MYCLYQTHSLMYRVAVWCFASVKITWFTWSAVTWTICCQFRKFTERFSAKRPGYKMVTYMINLKKHLLAIFKIQGPNTRSRHTLKCRFYLQSVYRLYIITVPTDFNNSKIIQKCLGAEHLLTYKWITSVKNNKLYSTNKWGPFPWTTLYIHTVKYQRISM